MARKLNPKELADWQTPKHEETGSASEQDYWLQKVEQQRDAILRMSPELREWFGELFESQAHR